MAHGIDYGNGTTNVGANGIRFGVIPLHALGEFACEAFEDDYGAPTCVHCGNEAEEYDDEKHGDYKHAKGCSDYACEHCERVFASDDGFGDEPVSSTLESDGYKAELCRDGDVFVCASEFYALAAFCSPCAPGACYLLSPVADGARAYCFGHDWFTSGVAPYPVYAVATGELIAPGSGTESD